MNENYTQPFFVPPAMAKRLGYDRSYYLPPLEPKETPGILPLIPPEHRLYGELQQLKGRFIHLQNQYNEHLDKKDIPLPSPPKYIYSNIIEEGVKPDVSQHFTPKLHSATSPQHSATSQQDYIKNARNTDNARNACNKGE